MPSISTKSIVNSVKKDLLEPPLRIDQIIQAEADGIKKRRAEDAARQEQNR